MTSDSTDKSGWNPNQYEKFKDQRIRPFLDLLEGLKPSPGSTVLDLGCGTGEWTRRLHEEFKAKSTLGLDSSDAMLDRAQTFAGEGLKFQKGTIETFRPTAPVDLLFSNAALHWVQDHEKFFPKILQWVRPGGQVAIQMPYNADHPSHVIAARVANENFSETFKSATSPIDHVLEIGRYAELLFAAGFETQNCFIKVYGVPMQSGSEVIEWVKGALLSDYRRRLNPEQYLRFLEIYSRTLLEKIGTGPYFYAFKRVLLLGQRKLN